MGSPRLKALELGEAERSALEALAARRRTAQGLALRARIVLACAETGSPRLVGARLDVHPATVRKWRHRFARHRLGGLRDQPRSGAPRQIGDQRIEAVISRTLESLPADGTHRSSRGRGSCAALPAGGSGTARWPGRAACPPPRCSGSGAPSACSHTGSRPSSCRPTPLEAPPPTIAKVRDVVGLYMAPPDRALVLCVDEKSQIQALDRTQPLLPMRPGQVERRSHDYKRPVSSADIPPGDRAEPDGTTSLFAALDVATGRVIGKCFARHRAAEFRRFLDAVEAHVPSDVDVHLVMDTDSTQSIRATHKAPTVRNWLLKRPHWQVHHTPTGASWLNQVERFFALLTDRRIRRGVHRSLASLRDAITTFIDQHNADPKPFRWTKSADDILASIERFCHRVTPEPSDQRTSESGH